MTVLDTTFLRNPGKSRSDNKRLAPKPTHRHAPPVYNTVLCLDVSPSMNWALDGSNSRLDAARDAIKTMIYRKRSTFFNDLIGLVIFSSKASVISDFRRPDDPALFDKLNSIRTHPSTNISAGLKLALDLHNKRPWRYRNIVLLTDGRPVYPDSHQNILSLAHSAARNKITIHTIGIGDGSSFDPDFLKAVAKVTPRGSYRHVRDLAGFTRAIVNSSR